MLTEILVLKTAYNQQVGHQAILTNRLKSVLHWLRLLWFSICSDEHGDVHIHETMSLFGLQESVAKCLGEDHALDVANCSAELKLLVSSIVYNQTNLEDTHIWLLI